MRGTSDLVDLVATLRFVRVVALEFARAQDQVLFMKVQCALAAPWTWLVLAQDRERTRRRIWRALATREALPTSALVPGIRYSAWPLPTPWAISGVVDSRGCAEGKGSRFWVLSRDALRPLAKHTPAGTWGAR